ncbi:MAG: Fic family protein [Gammaproteobacteria bacterium]|nr:Fic family protein [Gammaproteobacteria bacterium]MBL4729702.1 Fic family protein [Gammaproteobacteria bacterium]
MADPYLIPGTQTLRNKLNITDPNLLQEAEQDLSSARDMEIARYPVPGNFDYQHLKDIHKKLFGDVYPWAGEPRTVDIHKASTFAPARLLEQSANKVFGDLAKDGYLRGLEKGEFIVKAATHFGEINFVHPFRDGNGRTQRVFFDHLAARAGHSFDWSRIDQKEIIQATIHATNNNPSLLKDALEKVYLDPLTDKSRDAKLEELKLRDPKQFNTLMEFTSTARSFAAKTIHSSESARRFVDATTDKLLDQVDQGRALPKIAPNRPASPAKDIGPKDFER